MIHRIVLLFIFLCLPLVSQAAVPTWKMVPNESHLTFTATQNGAPVTGEFKKFNAEIHFDPDALKENSIKVTVDIASISDAYDQLADTLKEADWFNAKVFPQAVFTSKRFVKTSDKTYQAEGMLTIRNKTLPITLNFTQEALVKDKARIKGSATIKRTAFGVGQGEWASTAEVKDPVKIDFSVTAIKE